MNVTRVATWSIVWDVIVINDIVKNIPMRSKPVVTNRMTRNEQGGGRGATGAPVAPWCICS